MGCARRMRGFLDRGYSGTISMGYGYSSRCLGGGLAGPRPGPSGPLAVPLIEQTAVAPRLRLWGASYGNGSLTDAAHRGAFTD